MQQFRPTGFQILPTVVKNLLITNGLMFLATYIAASNYNIDLLQVLGLHYFTSPLFRPYQLVTHMFMHAGFQHIIFNMFALWMFGSVMENYWGPKRFFIFYFVCGIGAALSQLAVYAFLIAQAPDAGTATAIADGANMVGASGAIMGVLLAYGMTFPNEYVYLQLFIPIKAKYFVLIYGAIELFSGVFGYEPDVAHFAHLGGMLFGFILIKYWNSKMRKNFF